MKISTRIDDKVSVGEKRIYAPSFSILKMEVLEV